MIRILSGMLAIASAMPALAQDARTARFQVTGVEISLPIPKGYCLPQGKGVTVSQLVAATDDANVTNLTLHQCGDETRFMDYYILKTSKILLALAVSREDLIAQVVEALDEPAVKESIDPAKVNPEVERSFATVVGEKPTVNGGIRWLGHDEVCVYLAGVMTFKTSASDSAHAVSGCLTAVGGRAVNVYRYSDGADPANATRYLPDVKAMALSMQGAPAH